MAKKEQSTTAKGLRELSERAKSYGTNIGHDIAILADALISIMGDGDPEPIVPDPENPPPKPPKK